VTLVVCKTGDVASVAACGIAETRSVIHSPQAARKSSRIAFRSRAQRSSRRYQRRNQRRWILSPALNDHAIVATPKTRAIMIPAVTPDTYAALPRPSNELPGHECSRTRSDAGPRCFTEPWRHGGGNQALVVASAAARQREYDDGEQGDAERVPADACHAGEYVAQARPVSISTASVRVALVARIELISATPIRIDREARADGPPLWTGVQGGYL
jgi:hypothetical protein